MTDTNGQAAAILMETARVASVMVDGDEALRIITPRAMQYIASPDPEFGFLSGDYYDVDHGTFLRMKKLLLRLEKLVPFECATKLWVKVDGLDKHVTLAVQNGAMNRYWTWAQEKLEMPQEMLACFSSGKPLLAPPPENPGTVTALAPVENSLGDIVAVVEITAQELMQGQLPPAWA